jgi:hypothetical protein
MSFRAKRADEMRGATFNSGLEDILSVSKKQLNLSTIDIQSYKQCPIQCPFPLHVSVVEDESGEIIRCVDWGDAT